MFNLLKYTEDDLNEYLSSLKDKWIIGNPHGGKTIYLGIAASVLLATAAQALPSLPMPPPFANSGYLEIDVKSLPPGLTAQGCSQTIQGIASATGLGAVDDGCAVQAALDEVARVGGGVVYLPAG